CDYLLKVAVNGTKGYEQFLTNTLYKFPYMRQSRSTFTLRCLKKAISVLP
ncbi:MAG: AsnC family transcriptional regulator, partial [Pseudomonadota bacterium]